MAILGGNSGGVDSGVVPLPLPRQKAQREGWLEVGDGHSIWYFDTGGDGTPVVLLHAGTGSGLMWGYQQPVFADAGYRVVGYSRRGRANARMGDPDRPGIGSEDLLKLADHLRLDKFHLVGTAAGGMVATDFTVSHEDRVKSLVLANTVGGVTDESYRALFKIFVPPGLMSLPADFRELSASYRHLNPEGQARWNELEHSAAVADMKLQEFANKVTWEHLAGWKLPVLVMTGDADMAMPPSVMRLVQARIPNSESYLVPECSHTAFWERPEIFNRVVLDFFSRHDS